MKVTFNYFQLDDDVLEFYDGMNAFSRLLGSYSGTTHPEVIYSTGQYLYVKFVTSGSFLISRGFSFSFSAVEEGTFNLFYSLFTRTVSFFTAW